MNPITLKQVNPHNYKTDPIIDFNLNQLIDAINIIQESYGKQLTITSGLRSDAQQKLLIAAGKSKATKSLHLSGEAIDVSDADSLFWAFLMKNIDLLEKLGIYLEDKNSTPTWTHLQLRPPKSGKRIFIP